MPRPPSSTIGSPLALGRIYWLKLRRPPHPLAATAINQDTLGFASLPLCPPPASAPEDIASTSPSLARARGMGRGVRELSQCGRVWSGGGAAAGPGGFALPPACPSFPLGVLRDFPPSHPTSALCGGEGPLGFFSGLPSRPGPRGLDRALACRPGLRRPAVPGAWGKARVPFSARAFTPAGGAEQAAGARGPREACGGGCNAVGMKIWVGCDSDRQ